MLGVTLNTLGLQRPLDISQEPFTCPVSQIYISSVPPQKKSGGVYLANQIVKQYRLFLVSKEGHC